MGLMKNIIKSVLVVVCMCLIGSCGSREVKPDAEVIASINQEKEVVLNENLGKRVGEWVDEGVECYGIIISTFTDGRTVGKPVKAKVMSVKTDKIKMKAVESVSIMEAVGCDKLGLDYGETWWETEGDIFRTREDAVNYLLNKGWYIE